MPKRDDYEKLWTRFQAEGVPNKISIERFCVSNGFSYREFEKWYNRVRNSEFVPIQVDGVPSDPSLKKGDLEAPAAIKSPDSPELTIKCIRIEFADGTELRNRGVNLSAAMALLQKFAH